MYRYTVSASSEATCQELGKRTLYSLGKMKLWQNGDIDTLLHEGRSTCSLQSRLMTLRRQLEHSIGWCSLERYMQLFECSHKMRLGGACLWMTQYLLVMDRIQIINNRQYMMFPSKAASWSINPCHDLIIFEQITGEAVWKAALHTKLWCCWPFRGWCLCMALLLLMISRGFYRSMQCYSCGCKEIVYCHCTSWWHSSFCILPSYSTKP